LTILARVSLPFMGSYCASKAAALSLTQACAANSARRASASSRALPGAIDTRMTAVLTIPKMTTAEAAAEILDGFRGRRGRHLCRRDGARHRGGARDQSKGDRTATGRAGLNPVMMGQLFRPALQPFNGKEP